MLRTVSGEDARSSALRTRQESKCTCWCGRRSSVAAVFELKLPTEALIERRSMQEMLTSVEVAKVLRLNRRSIENRIRTGEIRGFGIPLGKGGRNRWLVRQEDLEAYLARQATACDQTVKGEAASE